MRRNIPIPTLFASALALCGACGQASAEGWDWAIEPYLWAAGIGTNLRTFQPPTEAESNLTFGDVISKLDGVLLLRVEGRGDDFGAFVDVVYLGLGDHKHRRVLTTRTDLDARLIDAAVSWRPGGNRNAGLDLYAGLRYLDIDLTVRFTPDNPEFGGRSLKAGPSDVDFLAGARYTWPLSQQWSLIARGDVSEGESKGTWSGAAMLQRRTGNGMWLFGYRYMKARFGSGNMDVAVTLSGPQVGYGFVF